MEEIVNAVVIRSVDYGENDKILTLFTMEKGVISARIKGVKKQSAKLKVFAEPFCFSEYVLVSKNNFFTVINASIRENFYSIRLDIEKFYAGNAILEFVRKFSPENVEAKELFFALINAMKSLSENDNTGYNLLCFLIEGLKQTGYALSTQSCAFCGNEEIKRAFFDFSSGQVFCENCQGEVKDLIEISIRTLSALNSVLKGIEIKGEEEYLKRATRLVNKYISVVTGEQIKSLTEYLSL